jgi:hypothetical protein
MNPIRALLVYNQQILLCFQEVLAELCKLVVKDITTLESPVIIRLLHCVLRSEQYDSQFRASVYTEIDRRIEASAFSVSELCAVIEELSVYVMRSPEGLLSGAWREFWQRVSSARAGDVALAYRTLARLAPPGSAVPRAFAALETAVGRCWRDLEPSDVATIAEALTYSGQGEGQDNPALLVPWLGDKDNILRLSGAQMKHVIAMFDRLRYSTVRVSEMVTLYTCTHWASMDGPLLGQIMEYFRRRAYLSKPAFDAVARGVEANPGQLEKRDIFKILRVFGQLNYTPPNLGAILSKMEWRFWQFNGAVLLELMASFVYIERYPTNFYKDLLSLHFLAETFSKYEIQYQDFITISESVTNVLLSFSHSSAALHMLVHALYSKENDRAISPSLLQLAMCRRPLCVTCLSYVQLSRWIGHLGSRCPLLSVVSH